MMIKIKKDKINEINSKIKSKDIVTQNLVLEVLNSSLRLRGTQRQFSEKICSEDDLRSRIFGTFVVKFLAHLPLLGFSDI